MTFYVIIKIEQMKKIISTLLCVIGLVTFSFAQDGGNTASTNGTEKLAISKTSGIYEFTLPSAITKDQLENSAKYYTSDFTVAFDEASHKATITMVRNEMKNRFVITRLLSSLKVSHVAVDEKTYELYEFIDTFLK